MIIISFFWKNGCCKDRRVKSSNLSISICRSDCEEEGWSWNLESDGSIPYVSRMHLKNFVLSVACRHAIKSNIQTCLWKRASISKSKHPILHTYLENRILNKNELNIQNQNIKTSEAIQEIVWKKQTCKCESVYENLEPKRPTLWTFGGPAATRGGKSFG